MYQTNHHWVISEFRVYVESSVMGSSHGSKFRRNSEAWGEAFHWSSLIGYTILGLCHNHWEARYLAGSYTLLAHLHSSSAHAGCVFLPSHPLRRL